MCCKLLAAAAAARGGGGGDIAIDRSFFDSKVTFLENITQIEHKIPILNSAFCGDWGIDSLIL